MRLRPSPFSNLAGGLHLLDQASELDSNVALSLANVRMGVAGEVRSRPGISEFRDVGGAYDLDSLGRSYVGGGVILGAAGPVLSAFDEAGALVDSEAVSAADGWSFQSFGQPTAERAYAANGTDLLYFDGAVWVKNQPVTVNGVGAQQCPRPHCLGVTPWDNRLMVGGFDSAGAGPGGVLGSPSTVFFFDEGDPTSIQTTSRETLFPGDGERITAIVPWREFVFVFKQTKFFVFTGTTSVGSGIPSFDFYPVQARCGASGVLGACAGRDGVYFLDRNGVYRTQGGEPELLSVRLDPFFTGRVPQFYTGPRPATPQSIGDGVICAAGERIHVGFDTIAGRATLVYDPRYQWWGVDTQPMGCGGEDFNGNLLLGVRGAHRIAREDVLVDTDLGAAFDSHWRSSWLSFGEVGEKIVRRIRLWGEGIVLVRGAVDFAGLRGGGEVDFRRTIDLWGDGSEPSDVWGDGSDPGDSWGEGLSYSDGWLDYSWRGEVFSMEVRSVSGQPWSIQRGEHHVGMTEAASTDSMAN